MKIVKVEWWDSYTSNFMLSLEEIKNQHKLKTSTSIGILVDETEKWITIIGLQLEPVSEDDEVLYKYAHFIPKCAIEKITELKEEDC